MIFLALASGCENSEPNSSKPTASDRQPDVIKNTDTAFSIEAAYQDLPAEALPGGHTTFIGLNPITSKNSEAFSQPFANLDNRERLLFAVGNSFFTNPWVTAPASTAGRDGLGPLFNAAACQDCHIRDGRGHPPSGPGQFMSSAVLRIALPDGQPDPVYGLHIQTRSIPELSPEAKVAVYWDYVDEVLPDGEVIELRRPRVELSDLRYGKLSDDVQISLRVAPPMLGMGLLEAIPEADIQAYAAQQSGLGLQEGLQEGLHGNLKGIVQRALDVTTNQETVGRFGWKATQPTVKQQSLDAFKNDLGITSALFAQDACTPVQNCQQFPHGGEPELTAKIESALVFYAAHLAPPARRDINQPEIRTGQNLFTEIGCAGCHKPNWHTGQQAALSKTADQLIWPYTDMLLHDMGAGLADGIREGQASGRHWRTAPLWGLGHAKSVGGQLIGFLHDGRARNLSEAILWHDGEARSARRAWANLSAAERKAMIAFLQSL